MDNEKTALIRVYERDKPSMQFVSGRLAQIQKRTLNQPEFMASVLNLIASLPDNVIMEYIQKLPNEN